MNTKLLLLVAVILLVGGGYYFLSTQEAGGVNPADYGSTCSLYAVCQDNVTAVDCGQAFDGPLYYVNSTTGDVLATCGGACMGGNCDLQECSRLGQLCLPE